MSGLADAGQNSDRQGAELGNIEPMICNTSKENAGGSASVRSVRSLNLKEQGPQLLRVFNTQVFFL